MKVKGVESLYVVTQRGRARRTRSLVDDDLALSFVVRGFDPVVVEMQVMAVKGHLAEEEMVKDFETKEQIIFIFFGIIIILHHHHYFPLSH